MPRCSSLRYFLSQGNQKPIKELKLPRDAVFGGIIRDGKALMSFGDFQIREGDKDCFLFARKRLAPLKTYFSS